MRLTANFRNKMAHWEDLSDEEREPYQEGLSLLIDFLGTVFLPYCGKHIAVVHEVRDREDRANQGIFCYWDGVTPVSSDNPKRKRKIRSLWNREPRPGLEIFPAPDPPNPSDPSKDPFRWDESLLLFDPESPYSRSVYLMPLGFRFRHRGSQTQKIPVLPGLVDSVRWLRDKVGSIIQRTYAGYGPDICIESGNVCNEEGVDRVGMLVTLEQIAKVIRDSYQLELPKKSRIFIPFKPWFDLGHGKEALNVAEQSVGRPDVVRRMREMVTESPHQRLLLAGPSGCGKTCLAAQFYRESEGHSVYLSFDCSIPEDEADVSEAGEADAASGSGDRPAAGMQDRKGNPTQAATIRMHYLSGLCEIIGAEAPSVKLSMNEVHLRIRSMMKQRDRTSPIFIIADGLNQSPDPEQAIFALPDPLPENLYLVAATQPVDTVIKEMTRRGRRHWARMNLSPLGEEETGEIINFYWNPKGRKKLEPLSDVLTREVWSLSKGLAIFVREWTEELRRLYEASPDDFHAKAGALLKSGTALRLPASFGERFDAVLEDFDPQFLGRFVCWILSLIPRALTAGEIHRGLGYLRKCDLPDDFSPPASSLIQTEAFLGKMAGFLHRDETGRDPGYRFVHELLGVWFQERYARNDLLGAVRLGLAPLGCLQLTPADSNEDRDVWIERIREDNPVYKDLPATVRTAVLVSLRESLNPRVRADDYYYILSELIYVHLSVTGEAFRAFDLQTEAEEGLTAVLSKRTKAFLLMSMGDIQNEKGNLKQAMEFYQESLEVMEVLTAESPTIQNRRELSVSHNRVGDIRQAQGDLDEALACFQKDIEISEALATESPTIQNRRDLSVSCYKIGGIRQAQGDSDEAMVCFQKSLEISEALAAESPTIQNRQDISFSYNRVGDIHAANGDTDQASVLFQKDLELRKALSEEFPTDENRRKHLRILEKLCSMARKQEKESIPVAKEGRGWNEALWNRFLEDLWIKLPEDRRTELLTRFPQKPEISEALQKNSPLPEQRPAISLIIAAAHKADNIPILIPLIDFKWLEANKEATEAEDLHLLSFEQDHWGIRWDERDYPYNLIKDIPGFTQEKIRELELGLAGSVSLSEEEKRRVIESLPRLSSAQIEELCRILHEEILNFAALEPSKQIQLAALALTHRKAWEKIAGSF